MVSAMAAVASATQPSTNSGGQACAHSNPMKPSRIARPCSTTPSGASPQRSMPMKVDIVTTVACSQTLSPVHQTSSSSGASASAARTWMCCMDGSGGVALLQHDDLIVAVMGIARSALHRPGAADAGQNDAFDLARPQRGVQAGGIKSAHARLDDHQVCQPGMQFRMEFCTGAAQR